MDITLVLLPGMDGTGILFEPLLKHLPPQISPIVIPLPNDKPMDYDQLIPILMGLLPKDRRYVLLGESFSGPLALQIAALNPPGLMGIVLCASFIRNPTYLPSFFRHFAAPWILRLSPMFVQENALFAGHTELRSLFQRANANVPAEVMARRVRAILRLDCKRELESCPVPIAYIRGSQDKMVPLKNCKEIISINGSVREFVIPAPHLILQTQPGASAEAITRFASSIT